MLQLLKLKLTSEIENRPGYLLEDSYKNMLHYIGQPITKNLDESFNKIASMDQRRGIDSSKIFIELYKLREGN